jgi:predicted O-methyltransferase YrrM
VSGSLAASVHQQRFMVSGPNHATVDFVRSTTARHIAEIGIYRGDTSQLLAEHLAGEGELHLFDFDHRVADVLRRLHDRGHRNVVGHPNSTKAMDSYNWSLLRVLEERPEPCFDYVFLDGAHTWPIDALAFLLVDRLVVPGGHIDFDDHDWTLARSPTMRPQANPVTTELYTDEQIARPHVKAIIDLLVRRDARYEEVVENKVFKKTRA